MSSTLLVLGGSSDIGLAIAHQYAGAGWTIILAGRDMAALQRSVTDIRIRYGVDAEASQFDAMSYSTHKSFWDLLPNVPQAVVWAVGYLDSQQVSQLEFAEARRSVETNFLGALSILSVVATHFETRKSGSIIGISSVAGDRGRQSNYVYGSAKSGLSAMLSGLRARLVSADVRVITVKPGFVSTKMTQHLALPKGLTNTPQDIALRIFQCDERAFNGTIYPNFRWRLIMLVVRCLPESLFIRVKF